MNQLNKNLGQAGRELQEEIFFLADLIGARAYMHERKIGKVQDLVAVDRGKLAEVTHVQIATAVWRTRVVRPAGQGPLAHAA